MESVGVGVREIIVLDGATFGCRRRLCIPQPSTTMAARSTAHMLGTMIAANVVIRVPLALHGDVIGGGWTAVHSGRDGTGGALVFTLLSYVR